MYIESFRHIAVIRNYRSKLKPCMENILFDKADYLFYKAMLVLDYGVL